MDNQIHLLKLISCHMVQIKMAVIVIVYESGVPANLYYMVREPEYESTLQEYLKSGGCSAKFLLSSQDYEKARHIISCEYAKLKVVSPRVVEPKSIMTLIG